MGKEWLYSQIFHVQPGCQLTKSNAKLRAHPKSGFPWSRFPKVFGLCGKKIWSKYWTPNVCYICQGIVGCTPIPTYPYGKPCALTTWRHWPDHLLCFSVSKANLFQISQQRRILTLRAAVMKRFKCRSPEKGAFLNMATLRSPGLKVKLLVGPTCKIPTINSKERTFGNKAITVFRCAKCQGEGHPTTDFSGASYSPLRFLKVKVLLMGPWNPAVSPVEGQVVYPIIFFQGFSTIPGGFFPDFSHQQ